MIVTSLILLTVIDGDFLTRYVASIGNFGAGRGGNGITNNFLSTIRSRIDFMPGDDDDDEMGQNSTSGPGLNVRGLLGDLISSIAGAAGQQFAGQGNAGGRACIRRVIEVIIVVQ